MAHFYGSVRGKARYSGSRCGNKRSGLVVKAMGHSGQLEIVLWHDRNTQRDYFQVTLDSPAGISASTVIAHGELLGPNMLDPLADCADID